MAWAPREGRVVFLDTETTGLDPASEEVFEIAVIDGQTGDEHVFRVEPMPEVIEKMHPKAAEVNRYHERTGASDWKWDSPHATADRLERLLTGAHIVGAVPDFDARFLAAFYQQLGYPVPRWHYHLMDIENLAYGWLLQVAPGAAEVRDTLATLPLNSDALSLLCGVEPVPEGERHTALGDARWVMRWWNQLHSGISVEPDE